MLFSFEFSQSKLLEKRTDLNVSEPTDLFKLQPN